MNTESNKTEPKDRLISANKASAMLDCHWRTPLRMAERGELRFFRIGRLIRFRESDIMALMGK
jgi:excisionase family DNA binding protein